MNFPMIPLEFLGRRPAGASRIPSTQPSCLMLAQLSCLRRSAQAQTPLPLKQKGFRRVRPLRLTCMFVHWNTPSSSRLLILHMNTAPKEFGDLRLSLDSISGLSPASAWGPGFSADLNPDLSADAAEPATSRTSRSCGTFFRSHA